MRTGGRSHEKNKKHSKVTVAVKHLIETPAPSQPQDLQL